MQSSTHSKKNSADNSRGRTSKKSLGSVLKQQFQIKDEFENLVNEEKAMLQGELRQLRKASRYVTENWKTIVPVVAAIAAGAYFFKDKNIKTHSRSRSRSKS